LKIRKRKKKGGIEKSKKNISNIKIAEKGRNKFKTNAGKLRKRPKRNPVQKYRRRFRMEVIIMRISHITYHISLITYHLSLITYHISCITYYVTNITSYVIKSQE